LYGPGDNFDLETSHVIPALIRKFYEAIAAGADKVTVWGTGKARREFLHVDDLASACLFLMEHYNEEEIINVGSGTDIAISELVDLIKEISGFGGSIVYDTSKPDGMPRKLLDVSRITSIGWKHVIDIKHGLKVLYDMYANKEFYSK
jgi:GDP-L-fucose synthase